MKTLIRYLSGALLTLICFSEAGADSHSIRHEVEQFLTSGVGNIVMIILMLLFLLWLLLPLAVFGLKTKLNNLIQENKNLTRESKETNRMLADIRDTLAALSVEEPAEANSEQLEKNVTEEITQDTYDEIKFDP